MRTVLILLVCLLAFVRSYGQSPVKTQRTEFVLKAVDTKTSAELPARFTVKGLMAKKTWEGTAQAGKGFMFVMTRTDTLDVIANAPGYLESEELMVVSCDTCTDYEYTIKLDKATPKTDTVFRNLAVNRTIQLDNVYFDQSSYDLRPESYPQLDKLAKTLVTTPGLQIEIAGHTDKTGDKRLNQALSENRAKVIAAYLTRQGIAETRLRAKGYGGSRLAAPSDSEENRQKNRRVEFVVLAL